MKENETRGTDSVATQNSEQVPDANTGKKKGGRKRLVGIIVGMIIFALVAAVAIPRVIPMIQSKNESEIISKAMLEKIINVSDLSSFEAVYNGIAKVTNENDPGEVDYYVSYEAKVKAGIDFSLIEMDVDKTEKVITIKLPEIKIIDVPVDIASMDYIFMDKSANTETVSEAAYRACNADAKKESTSENEIYNLAKDNAKNIIEALIRPFVEQSDETYRLEII